MDSLDHKLKQTAWTMCTLLVVIPLRSRITVRNSHFYKHNTKVSALLAKVQELKFCDCLQWSLKTNTEIELLSRN